MKEDKQPVDVLARIAAVWGEDSPEYAAVAELVEAVKQYRADYSTAGCPLPECRVCARSNAAEARLNAALARVGGVK